ncbi:TPA: helix-turn-helix transcriptional regulator [Morganella morganii]|nr:helix-turn-helix transcriptional regulator [Morganella morganii]
MAFNNLQNNDIVSSSIDIMVYVGQTMKKFRLDNNMSGEVLGNIIGVSQQQISRYERGESEITVRRLDEIALAFNMTLFQFFEYIYHLVINDLGYINKN